jgi:hypothetical protein
MSIDRSNDEGEVPVRGESIKPPDETFSLPGVRNEFEEGPRANELVPQANGVVPRSGTSEVLDRVFLRILLGGGMVIGAILAARVKQVGPVKFYEGIPVKLPDVLRAGAKLAVS